ncbi:MAG: M48 family metallopeptidase [Methylocella sp.]
MLRLFRRDPPPAREADFIDVAHDGEIYRIRVRRTSSAKRFTLRIRTAARDIVLTMPARASFKHGKSFAERHSAWIGAKLRHLPEKIGFEPGDSVPLRGVPHKIALAAHLRERDHDGFGSNRSKTIVIESKNLEGDASGKAASAFPHPTLGAVVSAPPGPDGGDPVLWVRGDAAFTPRRVQDFLIREARRDLAAAVGRHTARLGVKVRKITLRDTSSRWGSCSASGGLNFSWRLILAPPFVLDYLAAHEVAHLVHMNHSDAFWTVVGGLSQDVDAAEAWLKTHGPGLLRFGGGNGAARSRS